MLSKKRHSSAKTRAIIIRIATSFSYRHKVEANFYTTESVHWLYTAFMLKLILLYCQSCSICYKTVAYMLHYLELFSKNLKSK